MASPFKPGARRSNSPFAPTPVPSPSRGPVGFLGNLVGDVKDAVIGLPAGAVETVRNPIKSAKAVGGATWHTWSPLFSGDFAKFGKQLYDHPLAPLLDVATVFTLGAGSAAKGASMISKAGVQSAKVEKLASLRTPRALELADPQGKRLPVSRNLSTRPGRRAVQELMLTVEPHLPRWYQSAVQGARFEKRHAIRGAHAVAAKNRLLATSMNLAAAMKAGEILTDPETAPAARAEIAAHSYLNLLRHNQALDPAEAARLVKGGKRSEYGYIVAAGSLDRQSGRMLRKAQRMEAKWDKQRAESAELSHALPKIEKELAEANRELERMYADGVRVVAPHAGKGTARQKMEQEAAPILDVERRVKDLESLRDKAYVAQGLHNKAVGELEALKRSRMELEKRSFREYFRQASYNPDDFEKFMLGFGNRVVTRDAARAARTNDGKVYVVHVGDARKLGWEANSSSKAVQYLWRKPTTLWKTAMIGYTPRTITNNAVGNWAIYALREGMGPDSAKAIHDAIRLSHGEDVAANVLRQSTPFKKNNWLYRHFGDELGNVFGHEMMLDGLKAGNRAKKMARQGLYGVVHTVADEPVRVAAIAKYLRESSEVKALMDKGLSFDQAAQRALRRTPGLRSRAAEHARVTAGDYFTLRPVERVIRDLMPFYLWNRHILKTSGNMLLDTPGRVAVMQRISNLGIERTEELLGELPEFLRGALPLELLGFEGAGGRADVLLTHSLNPFATVGELADMAQAFTVGEGPRGLSAALAGANPILTGGIESVTGRSILTGAPKPTVGGLPASILAGMLEGLPQVKLTQALTTEDTTVTPSGEEFLYGRDDRSPVSSLFGIPLRDVSLQRAHALREQQDGKRKRRSASPFQP